MDGTQGNDYERRSYWQATMPALPDRSGRPLPDTADVVVIGGGYAGINAARELARRGTAVTLVETHTLGWGASTRNGGIVHAGYKLGPTALLRKYGPETGKALYQETLESYALIKRLIADEAIDCDFREHGHLELAYGASHVRFLEEARRASPRSASPRTSSRGSASARRSGPTPTTARSRSRTAR